MKVKKFFLLLCLFSALITACKKDNVEPELEINTKSLLFDDLGRPETDNAFSITSNANWNIFTSEEWCRVNISKGSNSKSITISLTVNEEADDRYATITIQSKGDLSSSITVKQGASENIANRIVDPIFKKYCLDHFDLNGDHYLSKAEAERVETMNMSTMGITSLEGIKYFSGLKRLDCYRNDITFLDASGLSRLSYLDCGNNKITEIDISGCSSLVDFYYPPGYLKKLNMSGTAISTLIFSLYYPYTFTELIAQNCSKLTNVYCYFQTKLTTIDLSGCAALERLECTASNLQTLKINGCVSLQYLLAGETKLSSIDLKGCSELIEINLIDAYLSSLDLSDCVELLTLNCGNNELKALDVSGLPKLVTLNCGNNELKVLDVSGLPKLVTLNCSGNHLEKLDLQNNPILKDLRCQSNRLKTLDVTSCPELEYLFCGNNQLTHINTAGLKNITVFHGNDNLLTEINVKGLTLMNYLYCSDNQLTELDISENMMLQRLQCHRNPDLKYIYVWNGFDLDAYPPSFDLPNGVIFQYKN